MPVVVSEDENLTLCFPRLSSGQNPNEAVIVRTPKPNQLLPNHILVNVDRFGFSANNVTYQALGESPHFRYFDYNPAPNVGNVSPKTHGLIPVWGFGTVVKSTHPRIREGERVYGYFAPTRYLIIPVSPSDVNEHAFYVPRPHLPSDRRPYNQILRCSMDPHYDPSPVAENLTALYRPLFWTSYWCEDWLFSSSYRGGAKRVLISSASSKTAFCLAYVISKRMTRGDISGVKVVGITSKQNVAFTKGLALYHDVLDYDSFTHAPCLTLGVQRWIYIDVAGNNSLNQAVFAHFGSTQDLVASIALGMTSLSPSSPDASSTNWSNNTFANTPMPLSPPIPASLEQFFMVEWLNVRRHQLFPKQIFALQNEAWKELMKDCVNWVELEQVYGGDAVKRAYELVSNGSLGPDKGFIWSLWDEEGKVASKL